MPIGVEDLALSALVRILPRGRYRLAAQNDARFQSFAGNTTRIAYRQQGATPAFLLFSGPGQNPHSAALAAASWAEANWRPNAIQRSVRPGVVVVHVAPGNQLTPSGPVAGAAVPAVVWTVDSVSGKVEAVGKPPGSPSGGDIRQSADNLMRGVPAPSLGELDAAEKGVMQLRRVAIPRGLAYAVYAVVLIGALRYGLSGLAGVWIVGLYLFSGQASAAELPYLAQFGADVVMLAGILFGAALVFNFRNLGQRLPGFSSYTPGTRNLAWGGYVAAMIGLAIVIDGVLPGFEHKALTNTNAAEFLQVTATTDDDGSETYVTAGGELTVDLSGWPSSEWSGVQFKSSNPSVLALKTAPKPGGRPVAIYSANAKGTSRVDATSADGTYSFEVRVDVGASP